MATRKKHILLNAFNMNSVGHINHGLWAHPRDQSHRYKTLDYWTSLAATLERGLFDGIFLADILGVYDVYQGSADLTLRESIQLPVNDPLLLVSAMAAVTRHLGFGITVNASADAPYIFARRISTLDHLTDGRVGWNIVTGYLDSAARGLGLDNQIEHDIRYDRADDYLDLLYKLWEGSWEDGAVLTDKERRIYADPSKVHVIDHQGPFYRSQAYHLAEPSPQRTPVLYQAGTSGRGKQFAARHAECVFIAAPDKNSARAASRSLREAVVAAGRKPEDIKIFLGMTVITDRSATAAREKHAEYLHYANPEAGLAHFSASTGIDFSRYDLDEAITYGKSNASQSATQIAQQRGWTKRQLLQELAMGGRYPVVVGDATEVADELSSWMDEGEIDGFNLTRTVVPESFEDFIDIVVPALQERGLYKTAYEQGSLRRKLFGEGDRLPDRHIAASFRRP
ncbi:MULTISPECIES: LLM class flavin-dependent oxidoreductase [Rhizobium]|uniref:FMN-dependent oxidoreductase (Nitrilotriacetate monooxygenase family) n=1 Tax=Rhizobium tropici TaxID=398 RepID=A0A6P1CBN9_RHITR|nr:MULTISPECIES: LLM class flavin-dependent oxidoreductase [Rhizobium]AGB75481.1 monooxygenase, NtaA/SnaA/SoxA family [Rhizobium tropici CIAT 899]MBB4241853.1 FMN-dependent oxidoreductase (nitrilotriacetate monooxygenase family) [Rhizobium tropici]MBB5593500.1 FMN-dependent oxidoreductase (nitrilotriacetate monooxygenase family) [Rhizobium tropici]MBB6492178.1 FMN-dependent oxidoreductase (nitrilotriacetate monooxygenase family) [Rhizobium tropici]NEV13542.1 LLM class flavin-dependent oxidored